jgi:hypothetical protein
MGAPANVSFDDEDGVAFWQARIRVRVLDERTMPPAAPVSSCDAALLWGRMARAKVPCCGC